MRIHEITSFLITDKGSLYDLLMYIDKPEIVKHFYNNRIYRGIRKEDGIFFTKTSTNRYQYDSEVFDKDNYNDRRISETFSLMLDKLPSWSEFPPRSSSFICSTNSGVSKFYGNLYLVIPINVKSIAIHSSDDFMNMLKPTISTTKSIYEFTELLLKNGIIDSKGNIKKTVGEIKDEYLDSLFYDKENLPSEINRLLSPHSKGIKLVSPLEYVGGGSHEIWFEGEALFISWDYLVNHGGNRQVEEYLNEIK